MKSKRKSNESKALMKINVGLFGAVALLLFILPFPQAEAKIAAVVFLTISLICLYFSRTNWTTLEDWLQGREYQYAHIFHEYGIAIDPKSKKIYLKDDNIEKAYDFQDVREWRFNLIEPGIDFGQNQRAVFNNLHSQKRAKNDSGFFIAMKDIENPEWKIRFPHNDQLEKELKKWMEIFRHYMG